MHEVLPAPLMGGDRSLKTKRESVTPSMPRFFNPLPINQKHLLLPVLLWRRVRRASTVVGGIRTGDPVSLVLFLIQIFNRRHIVRITDFFMDLAMPYSVAENHNVSAAIDVDYGCTRIAGWCYPNVDCAIDSANRLAVDFDGDSHSPADSRLVGVHVHFDSRFLYDRDVARFLFNSFFHFLLDPFATAAET